MKEEYCYLQSRIKGWRMSNVTSNLVFKNGEGLMLPPTLDG